jgi:hypothetical protein
MTIVIAYRFLTHIAVFADCRVSYESTGAVDDNLQKIYQVGERMVLGFAGPVLGAHQVMSRIRENLSKTYPRRRRPVADNLMKDVERWIQHEYQEIRQPEARENLSFILASLEPSREARSRCVSPDGTEIPKPKWIPSGPELRTLALKPHRSRPSELYTEEKAHCKIIGIQDDTVRNAVQRRLDENFSSWYKQPLWIQARIAVDCVMITLMESGVSKTGGLLQCAMLGKWGVRWFPYESSGDCGNVGLYVENGRFMQRDNVTEETIPLLAVWEWVEWGGTHTPGSSGAFEDPTLRIAVERSERLKDNSPDDSKEPDE